ncbi:nucleotidyl transferase AbiEii/AbiGii toxin family protein [Streptomyces sp. NPDC001970]
MNGVEPPLRRAALDHVLRLIADAPWSDGLMLRGSMPLQAWLGPGAREPVDLDWIVHAPGPGSFPDRLSPYPYVDDIEAVQQWPEAAQGAARYEIWGEEEFSTFGARPVLPPEGLRWLDGRSFESLASLDDLVEEIRSSPTAPGGVTFDPDSVRQERFGDYDDDVHDDDDILSTWEYELPGLRIFLPWRASGDERDGVRGRIQLDFTLDEAVPDPPVWTAVPRGDGGPPTPVRTASRELSLAWKLLWLCTDCAKDRVGRGKDLYDAALLAECPRTRLTPRLLHRVLGEHAADFGPGTVRGWRVDGASCPGDQDQLRERLVRALGPVFGGR